MHLTGSLTRNDAPTPSAQAPRFPPWDTELCPWFSPSPPSLSSTPWWDPRERACCSRAGSLFNLQPQASKINLQNWKGMLNWNPSTHKSTKFCFKPMTLKVKGNFDHLSQLLAQALNRFMTLNESLNFPETWPSHHEMSMALSCSPGRHYGSPGTGLHTRDTPWTKQVRSVPSF